MSGPKSVRYVTREELIAQCQSLLVRLAELYKSWLKRLEVGGLLYPEDQATTEKVLKELRELLINGDTLKLQKRVAIEEAWMEKEIDSRAQAKVKAIEEENRRVRRRTTAVSVVLEEIKKRPGAVPDEVVKSLHDIVSGQLSDSNSINIAIRKAFESLAPNEGPPQITEKQRALANKLGVDAGTRSFSDWIAGAKNERDVAWEKLDHQTAQLEARYGKDVLAQYRERMDALAAAPNSERSNLKLDSLTLDIAQFARSQKILEALLVDANGIKAQLVDAGIGLEKELNTLTAAIQTLDSENLDAEIKIAKQALMDHQKAVVADGRRRTLLNALSQLGYTVTEGMETAWAENGRLIVEKPTLPGYGVELTGLKTNDKLQLRTVAYDGEGHDPGKDVARETEWCHEFSDLSDLLSADGHKIVIEKALGVGKTPIKVVKRQSRPRVSAKATAFRES